MEFNASRELVEIGLHGTLNTSWQSLSTAVLETEGGAVSEQPSRLRGAGM